MEVITQELWVLAQDEFGMASRNPGSLQKNHRFAQAAACDA